MLKAHAGIDASGASSLWEPTSTVNNASALVNIVHVHTVWMHPEYPSKAQECCQPPSKYRLHRTAMPSGWCLCTLGLVQ